MILKNKTALITGSNRGIGFSILEKFASEGCNIYAHSRKLTGHYHNFMNQANQPIGFGSSGLREFAERLARERILREAQPNRPKLSSHEEAFINEMDVFYTKYGVDMLNNGLLATKDSISRNITRLTKDVDEINAQLKIEKNTRAKVKLREMLGKQKARLKDQEDLLATGYDPKYKGVYLSLIHI